MRKKEFAIREEIKSTKEVTVSFVNQLLAATGKINYFSDDINDEFTVTRENGQVEGIFKTWAIPIIPFLEEGNIDILSRNLPNLLGDTEAKITLENWYQKLKNEPVKLWESLEKWRSFSEVYDRRLYQVFQDRKLPDDRPQRIAELYWRLRTAFALAAPFYHLEAMVGDSQNSPFNPINTFEESEDNRAGGLDVVGMMLPAALKNKVIADELQWNGLSWEKIDEISSSGFKDEELVIAARIARSVGVSVKDIIFAANVLQWIPTSVGGKKDDINPTLAQQTISSVLSQQSQPTILSVAKNTNALIRFLNWFPLVREDSNFSKGRGWRYAAVCDTANQLLDEISRGGVFEDQFNKIFQEKLVPQIKQLDATSAKGRFLLSLILEGRLQKEYSGAIQSREKPFIQNISSALTAMEENESVVSFDSDLPRSYIGGKVAGLKEVAQILGKDKVVGGVVLTSEAINRWLNSFPALWSQIQNLERTNDVSVKIAIGKAITKVLAETSLDKNVFPILQRFPDDIFAVRSSSFDEDTIWNGTAAGIYESKLRINKIELTTAIKEVISSFFSEKAISYRYLHHLSDIPLLAINISSFVQGRGGAAFSHGDGHGWDVAIGDEASSVVSGNSEIFETHRRTKITPDTKTAAVENIGEMLLEAEKIYGGRIDMEFVIDNDNHIRILQMRSLRSPEKKIIDKKTLLQTIDLDTLSRCSQEDLTTGKRYRLLLEPDINLDQFQGILFRQLAKASGIIAQIVTPKRIPKTCHFANICVNLGIELISADEL